MEIRKLKVMKEISKIDQRDITALQIDDGKKEWGGTEEIDMPLQLPATIRKKIESSAFQSIFFLIHRSHTNDQTRITVSFGVRPCSHRVAQT